MKKVVKIIITLLITAAVFVCPMPAFAGSLVPVIFEVNYESNLAMAKYDINVYLDDEYLGRIENGEKEYFLNCTVKIGNHTLRFQSAKDSGIRKTYSLYVGQSGQFYCSLKSHLDYIEIRKAEYTKNVQYDTEWIKINSNTFTTNVDGYTYVEGDYGKYFGSGDKNDSYLTITWKYNGKLLDTNGSFRFKWFDDSYIYYSNNKQVKMYFEKNDVIVTAEYYFDENTGECTITKIIETESTVIDEELFNDSDDNAEDTIEKLMSLELVYEEGTVEFIIADTKFTVSAGNLPKITSYISFSLN